MDVIKIPRRTLLRALPIPAAMVLGFATGVGAQGPALRATPSCGEPTARQTEGPFFKPASPRRASLVDSGPVGVPGVRLVVSGRVLSTDCRPIPRALVDVWQADARGEYDNAGFTLRGHHFADESGRYRFETIVPGSYPGRTRHIHLKVQAPGQPVLTTQLYFEGDPQNRRDGLFDPALVLVVRDAATVKVAEFDFVLRVT